MTGDLARTVVPVEKKKIYWLAYTLALMGCCFNAGSQIFDGYIGNMLGIDCFWVMWPVIFVVWFSYHGRKFYMWY